jgi:hypothetical protein
MATRLPAELSDRIVDYLHDDPKALRTCSSVCRAWLPAARYHRWFHTSVERSRIVTFLSLLVDIPDLSSYISRLDLFHPSALWRRRMGQTLTACDPETLDFLLNLLPNLRSLELKGWCIKDEVIQLTESNPTYRALRDLAFIECDFDTFNTVARLTTSGTSTLESTFLNSITLWEIHILEMEEWLPPADLQSISHKLSLSRLADPNVQRLFKWMLHSVTSLQLVILDWRDATVAGEMLRSVDNTLREVDLVIDTMSSLQGS